MTASAEQARADAPSRPLDRTAAARELRRLHEDALYTYKGHYNAAVPWNRRHVWMGASTAVFGAAAATSFATDVLPWAAAVLSLLAALMAAFYTALEPQKKGAAHHTAGANFQAVHRNVRLTVELEAPTLGNEELIARIREIYGELDRLNKASPPIPRRAYNAARDGVEKGEADHAVDQ